MSWVLSGIALLSSSGFLHLVPCTFAVAFFDFGDAVDFGDAFALGDAFPFGDFGDAVAFGDAPFFGFVFGDFAAFKSGGCPYMGMNHNHKYMQHLDEVSDVDGTATVL